MSSMLKPNKLNEHEVGVLSKYVEWIGGISTASRKLDIPITTLRNALRGKEQREASVYLLREKLDTAREAMGEAA